MQTPLITDKGWTFFCQNINGQEESFSCKGLYNIRVKNTGEVSLKIDNTLEIPPGSCEPIGLDWLPCAMDQINFNWVDEAGLRSLTLTGIKIIDYCCE